jgi:hypothetical protein
MLNTGRDPVSQYAAQQQYYLALQDLDAARYQYLLSMLNIEALVGTLDEKDVQAVNAYLVNVSE